MATIENPGVLDASIFRTMPDELLLAQDLVQQRAVHAISFLLQQGCNGYCYANAGIPAAKRSSNITVKWQPCTHGHHGARLAIIRTHLRYAWSWLDGIEIKLTQGPD